MDFNKFRNITIKGDIIGNGGLKIVCGNKSDINLKIKVSGNEHVDINPNLHSINHHHWGDEL